jgi:hypothetical protein
MCNVHGSEMQVSIDFKVLKANDDDDDELILV